MPSVSSNIGNLKSSRVFHGSADIIIDFDIDLSRFATQFRSAQIWLDKKVVLDSTPYTPMQTGVLYKSGTTGTTPGEGIVQWVAPYARYLYYGKVMVDSATGQGPMHFIDKYGNEVIRFRKGAKLRPTSEKLKISKAEHPQAQPFWFEAAKAQNKPVWVRGVRRLAGGG